MSEIVRNGNGVTIRLGARLDTVNAGDFEREIEQLISESGLDVEFDCNNLDYISSSGLRVILKSQKKITANKGKMKLTGVKPQIRKIFDMTGFSRFLRME